MAAAFAGPPEPDELPELPIEIPFGPIVMPPIEMPPEPPDGADPDPPGDGPTGVTASGAGDAVTLFVQNSWAIVAPAADASRTSTRSAAPPRRSFPRRGRGASAGVSGCGPGLTVGSGSGGRANGDV